MHCVVMPAFNEAQQIAATVLSTKPHCDAVVVVDDGSSDQTGSLAESAGALVVRHPVNLGQGAAIQTGMEYALAIGARYISTLDADGQHDPKDLAFLREALNGGADIALGSRFLGRPAEGMPLMRRVILQLAVRFSRWSTGVPLSDAHNGLRMMTADCARRMDLRQNRMAHATELVSRIQQLGLRWSEVAVSIRYTPYSLAKGQSWLGSFRILKDLLLQRFAQ